MMHIEKMCLTMYSILWWIWKGRVNIILRLGKMFEFFATVRRLLYAHKHIATIEIELAAWRGTIGSRNVVR